MKFERMNERIIVQKNTITSDRYGNHIATWEDYYSCAAYADTYAAEEHGNEVIREGRSIIFEVRYCLELSQVTSTQYRVLFQDSFYDIESIDMMNYQKQMIRFTCRKQ